MSSKPSKALFATEEGQLIVRDDLRPDDPAPDELLIEVSYSGVNPADARHATHLGIRSTVIGYDFAGHVLKAPPGSKYSAGDLVAGYTPSGLGRPARYGSHQDYLAVPDDHIFSVPPNLPEPHAAALAVVTMTAADVVHNLFGFPLPTRPRDHAGPILIWGASSSVGLAAIQLARASGCRKILVTASPARHDLLKSLGAAEVFDYSSATVVNDIIKAVERLGRGPITHALDAVGITAPPPPSELVARCVSESTALSSVTLARDRRFQMPVAMTKDEWKIHPPGVPEPTAIPARPDAHWNAWKALRWAVDNYGGAFRLPAVKVLVIPAEEALEQVHAVANGSHGFGKVVFKHPL